MKKTYNREDHLKSLRQATNKFSYDKKINKAYFTYLCDIYSGIDWRNFKPWVKFKFFRRWFVAMSDEYKGAYLKHESLILKQYPDRENVDGIINYAPSGMYIYGQDSPTKETGVINSLIKNLFNLPLGSGRNFFLRTSDEMFEDKPVKKLSTEDVPQELEILKRFEKVAKKESDSQKFLLINVKYPSKLILEKIKVMINEEQKEYYLKYPELEKIYMKRTKDNKETTYPFDEWERYLKVYISKQRGIKTRELAEQYYSEMHVDPKRQILRDNQNAKKLSQNAVAGDFPGKY